MFSDSFTYDDILIEPGSSDIDLHKVNLKTNLTKDIFLSIPILSAAMDTVTESKMAISLAREGGIGVIHKNLSVEEQISEVEKVKRAANGIVINPVTLGPDSTLEEAKRLSKYYSLTTFPVVDSARRVVGILTNRDTRFATDYAIKVKDLMSKDVVKVNHSASLEDAKRILNQKKIEKLVLVSEDNVLEGLVCIKDILNDINFPLSCKDEKGRLRVGAACGVGDKELVRVKELIKNEVDVLVVDTAHGHHKKVIDMVKTIKGIKKEVSVIAGNVATAEGTLALIRAGADAVKVGVGPGSICTTRMVTGVGYPQASAVKNCSEIADKYDIPIIADGGVRYSGDIAKALALGASSVMLGSLFSGTKEAPGEEFIFNGVLHKSYRGMGSIGAMQKGSKDRYFQEQHQTANKLVPEGVEAAVPMKGSVKEIIYQLVGGLRSSMGYVGANDLKEFKNKSKFVRITNAGYQESHVHDVLMTKESPNYKR